MSETTSTTLDTREPSVIVAQQEQQPAFQLSRPPRQSLWARAQHEVAEDLGYIVGIIPGSGGRYLRAWYYGLLLQRLGRGAKTSIGLEIQGAENISVGDHALIGRHVFLCATGGGTIALGDYVNLAMNVVVNAGVGGSIMIGSGVGIGNNTMVRATPHKYQDRTRPIMTQGHAPGRIVIEDDVWIAANRTILPNTHIERGCVISAGSVVGGLVKAYSIMAGNPARLVGQRGS